MNTYTAQCGIKAQTGASVDAADIALATLAAVDYQGNRKDSNHSYGVTQYERGLQRGVQTKLPNLKSAPMLKINWTEEMLGGIGAAPWLRTMGGLGFVPVPVSAGDPGAVLELAVAGAPDAPVGIRPGLILQTSGGAKRVLVYGQSADLTKVYVTLLTGTPANNDVFSGSWNGVSASFKAAGAPDTGEVLGYVYRPQSEIFDGTNAVASPSFTVERRLGGQLHQARGCRGTGGITAKRGEPWLLRAEFTGVPQFQSGTKTPKTGGFLTGVPGFTTTPKVSDGMGFSLSSPNQGMVPVFTELSIDFGNTVTLRESVANADGYVSARITDRNIVGRIDPEHVLPGSGRLDFIRDCLDNDRPLWLMASTGSEDLADGKITLVGNNVRLTGDYEPGDRGGRVTSPLSLQFNGDVDDELFVFHVQIPA